MARPNEGHAWRVQRRRILERDGGMCQLKRDGCTAYATEVHHVHGWTPEARAADDDLVASCRNCNRAIGRPTGDPAPRPPATNW